MFWRMLRPSVFSRYGMIRCRIRLRSGVRFLLVHPREISAGARRRNRRLLCARHRNGRTIVRSMPSIRRVEISCIAARPAVPAPRNRLIRKVSTNRRRDVQRRSFCSFVAVRFPQRMCSALHAPRFRPTSSVSSQARDVCRTEFKFNAAGRCTPALRLPVRAPGRRSAFPVGSWL